MGTAPPPDGPPLASQQASQADAGFALGPPVAQLCGLKIPSFAFSINFNPGAILGQGFPPKLPSFAVSLGINCNSDNPLMVGSGLPWGGGRVSQADPDPDLALDGPM